MLPCIFTLLKMDGYKTMLLVRFIQWLIVWTIARYSQCTKGDNLTTKKLCYGCLTPLSTIFQFYRGGYQTITEMPSTYSKLLKLPLLGIKFGVFTAILDARLLVFCVVFCRSLFVLFLLCIVLYHWFTALPLWYHQTIITW